MRRLLSILLPLSTAACGGLGMENVTMDVTAVAPIACSWQASANRWSCLTSVTVSVTQAPTAPGSLSVDLTSDTLASAKVSGSTALSAGDHTGSYVVEAQPILATSCMAGDGFAQEVSATLIVGGVSHSVTRYNMPVQVTCQ